MTNMKPMTYEEFTDLNITSNLTDFVLYLQDREVITIEPSPFCITERINTMYKDWLEVAKEELKERNEYIEGVTNEK